MKKFLIAAFHITWFQASLVVILSALKYWMTSSVWGERLQLPLLWTGMTAFLILLADLGIGGHLENQGYTIENWVLARPNSKKRRLIGRFVHWGQVLPVALLYSFILYMAMPTSLALFIAFFAGVVLRNIIEYVRKKKNAPTETSS